MQTAFKLQSIAPAFGKAAAAEKLQLLRLLEARPKLSGPDARRLAGPLNFLRAYPDNAAVRRAVEAVAARLPPPDTVYEYSYGVLLQLMRIVPGQLEIDWEQLPDETPLAEALEQLVLPGERQALEAGYLPLEEWFALARPEGMATDLDLLIDLFERSDLPEPARVTLFERCDLPVIYVGPPSVRVTFPTRRIHYQRRPLNRARFALAPKIRAPLGKLRRGGQPEIDLALQALSVRSLEIHTLIYANPDEVSRAECGGGLSVLLIGTHPKWRGPWEILTFFLILKNGVPLAYGPAGIFGGCCEMGINLFPEFRGGEIRTIYAQLMRVLHQHLAVEYFFLDRYGMGVDNPEAIATGAFWFYRKLGFLPTDPGVAELALEEEARMRAEPGYRCDRRMLRRLSHTEAYLDLSEGRRRPFDFSLLGAAESRHVARRYAGDRATARKRSRLALSRTLGIDAKSPALGQLAPTLSLLPDLKRWSKRDLRLLARFVLAKDGADEALAARISAQVPRLVAGLRAITEAAD